jgi:hypothetical protein
MKDFIDVFILLKLEDTLRQLNNENGEALL